MEWQIELSNISYFTFKIGILFFKDFSEFFI